jgi:hypothetical protein
MGSRKALSLSLVLLAVASQGCTSPNSSVVRDDAPTAPPAAVSAGKPSAKIGAELLALYASYREAQQRGVDFRSSNPLLRVVEDRVVIDATAASDVRALEADLVALGLRNAAAFGRIVSGQLPIAAIPTLDTLASLAFARPAASQGRTREQPGMPSRP